MQPPLIDPRSYADVVAQTEQLATQFSGWQPPPDGQPDAGQALIGVFGRFAELVIERLNRAPDKNYLAFLNLIGASPLPPRPARVPLTFHLATGSPVDAVVPAGALAAAPPLAGEQDDVVFETERTLVVTRSQLQAVYVSDTENDAYDDRTAQATGAADQPFAIFTGDQRSPHQLFLAADPLLTQPGPKDVTLVLTSPDTVQWQSWPISWAYWDGADWQPVTASAVVQDGAWRVSLPALPALTPSAVNGIEAGWLRAQLGMPLPPGQSGQVPESAAIGSRAPRDLTLPLSPFTAGGPTQRFYLSADEAFAAGGAQVTLQIRLSQPGAATAVMINWFYQNDAGWQSLDQFDLSDGTQAFTRDGAITFHLPMSWPSTLYRSRTGRWLRVDLTSGQYTTPPEIEALTVSSDWTLPRLGGITVASQPGAAPSPEPPAAAFCNASGIDLSKDFYPLGQQPQFNDTCYVACPDSLARPGAVVSLSVTLTNPPQAANPPVPPVRTQDNPRIAWEVSDGSQWHAIASDYAFTSDGQLSFPLPDPIGPATVNGAPGYWLRARLAGGGYGGPASYRQNADSGYTYIPATFAPPVVSSMMITASAAQQPTAVPVTACQSYNDFGYTDHSAVAGLFTPFTPTADTDPALYLGFDQRFGRHSVTLFLEVEPPLPEQVAAGQLDGADAAGDTQTTWEYASEDGWQPLGAVDETQALSSRGLVTFIGPADLVPRACFGQTLCWLRLRWQAGTFPLPPQLRRVLLNTIWATQVTTVENEVLGSGNGDPGQSFTAAQTPVQPGQQVTVREPRQPEEIWMRWDAVPDFYRSGPRDRHYTIDPLSGVIRFGDGSYGMIPPIGQSNIRITYRTGGGEQGNRASATIVQLKSGVPYIDGVTNNQPSQGGAPTEPIDRVKARGPRMLRHRDRAVAAADLEDLALAASADVAAATAIVPAFDPYSLWLDPNAPVLTADHTAVEAGRMGVIIVPADAASPRPTPSLVLLGQVQQYVRERCPPTAGLWVAGPEWIAVTVQTTVVVASAGDADAAGDQARTALERYLHPLTGGPGGRGWAFGRRPHGSDLSALLEGLSGVDHVRSLAVSYQPQTADAEREAGLEAILARPLTQPGDAPERERDLTNWLDRALIYSGPHDVTVALG